MSTGALSLVITAMHAGVEVCFANPGTTEMPIVVALANVPGVRVVLHVFRCGYTRATAGWPRTTGRPAATRLLLGLGLANGLANLYNAQCAHTPIVNWIGAHPAGSSALDAPRTSDITALTKTVGRSKV